MIVTIEHETLSGYTKEGERRGWDFKETVEYMNTVLKDHLKEMKKEKLAAPEKKTPVKTKPAPEIKQKEPKLFGDMTLTHPLTGKKL